MVEKRVYTTNFITSTGPIEAEVPKKFMDIVEEKDLFKPEPVAAQNSDSDEEEKKEESSKEEKTTCDELAELMEQKLQIRSE